MTSNSEILGRRSITLGPRGDYYLNPVEHSRRALRKHAREMEAQGDPSFNGAINRVFEDQIMARSGEVAGTYKKGNVYYDTHAQMDRKLLGSRRPTDPIENDYDVVRRAKVRPPINKMPGDQKLTKNGLTQKQAAENNRKRQLRINLARRNEKSRHSRYVNNRNNGHKWNSGGGGTGRDRRVRQPSFPPMSYARNRKSGMIVTFRAGRKPGCLRMNFKFKVCQIGVANIAGIGSQMGFINLAGTGPTGGNASGILPVAPNMVYYYPSAVRQLVNMFTYYYINRCGLTISPRVNVNNNAVCTIAYSGDIEYLETHGLLSGGSPSNAVPTEGGLSGLTNSCTEVVYKECAIGANDVDKSRKFFTTTTSTFDNADINFAAASPSSLRQGVAGVFMLAGVKNGSDANGVVYNDVYMDLDIELCEFSPPVTADADLTFITRQTEEQKSDIDFDIQSTKSTSRKSTGKGSQRVCN